jgi:integrase
METFIIALLQETGVRASEACALQWEDIEYNERLIHIRKGKGGKYRPTIITPALEEPMVTYYRSLPKNERKGYIFRQASGKPIDRHGLRSRVKRIGKRVGITKVFPHLMRNYCATELLTTQNIAPHLVQNLLGHANIKTTMGYSRANLNHLRDAMRKLQ